jgi:hypothetical protein
MMAPGRSTSLETLFCNRWPGKARFWPTSNPSTGINLVFTRTPRGMPVRAKTVETLLDILDAGSETRTPGFDRL